MSMNAVVYKGEKEVAVEEVEEPELQHPNDVVVDITTTCICGSDLHMYEGRTVAEPGIVFGHENMGVVEEVGDVEVLAEWDGRPVAVRDGPVLATAFHPELTDDVRIHELAFSPERAVVE